MELYQGIDSFSGNPKSTAVKSSNDKQPIVSESEATVYVAKSMEELQNSMEIDVSLKVSYSVFSADAKSKYLHSLNITTNSVTVLIYSNKILTTESSSAAIPEDILSTMKSDLGIDNFVRKYGDSWVSEISKGGEYFITFTFYSQTKDEKTKVEAALTASGVVGGAKIDGSISTKISNAIKSSNVTVKIDKKLIGFSLTEPEYSDDTDAYIKALINFAFSLSSKTPDAPETTSCKVTPYEDLLPVEIDFNKVRQNRNHFLGNVATAGWGEMAAQLIQVMNTCNNYEKTYQFYGKYSDDSLSSKLGQIKKDLEYLINFVQDVGLNPNKVYEFTTPSSYAYGTPSLNYSVVVPVDASFLNGGGGGAYQDLNISDISRFVRLYSVQYSQGDIVDWLEAKYSDASSITPYLTLRHGTPGGSPLNVWVLGEDEFITSIYGFMGNRLGHTVVAGLFFKSNKGNTYGTAQSNANQKWDAKPGDILIGFSGRSGNNLDCLQPLVLRFSPATWNTYILRIGLNNK